MQPSRWQGLLSLGVNIPLGNLLGMREVGGEGGTAAPNQRLSAAAAWLAAISTVHAGAVSVCARWQGMQSHNKQGGLAQSFVPPWVAWYAAAPASNGHARAFSPPWVATPPRRQCRQQKHLPQRPCTTPEQRVCAAMSELVHPHRAALAAQLAARVAANAKALMAESCCEAARIVADAHKPFLFDANGGDKEAAEEAAEALSGELGAALRAGNTPLCWVRGTTARPAGGGGGRTRACART